MHPCYVPVLIYYSYYQGTRLIKGQSKGPSVNKVITSSCLARTNLQKLHNNDSVVDGDTWLLLLRPVLGQVPCSKDSTPIFSFGPSRISQDIHAYSHIHAWTLLTVRLWTYQDIVNAPINQSKTKIQLKPICQGYIHFIDLGFVFGEHLGLAIPLLYIPHTTPYKPAIHPSSSL